MTDFEAVDMNAPQERQPAPMPQLPDASRFGTVHGIMGEGAPEGVTLTDMTPEETTKMENRLYTVDQFPGVKFTEIDAPNNTVFDQDNQRTISMPQSLSETETNFLIKRDADKVKDFFALQETGGFQALGDGVKSFFASQPQVFGTLAKEQAELVKENKPDTEPRFATGTGLMIDGLGDMAKIARTLTVNFFGSDKVIEASQGIIDRNRKYMADAGIERPAEGGIAGIMYDIGQGGGSLLTAIGLTALTRTPATAGLYFGALQKASIYDEARQAGKEPGQASDLSSLAGTIEGALEFVGLDRFITAMKGNAAVTRFVHGMVIEGIQEGSQQAGEELVTQASGIRKNKPVKQTVEDILYQAALGAGIGGVTNVALGKNAHQQAKDAGLSDGLAAQIEGYVSENVDGSKDNMTEFIDRELAPIAADDASAQEFIKLMQNFSNDVELVNRDSLDPETRATFDKYVELFNKSIRDEVGVSAVEKHFYDASVSAGIKEDEAAAAAKLVGARADAASRALGVSPEEWYRARQLRYSTEQEISDFKEARKAKGKKGLPKGALTFGDGALKLSIFESADTSTLFHELGHAFLEDLRDVAKVTRRPRAVQDYKAVKTWLSSSKSGGNIYSSGITNAQHEKFARGFEQYLREGKAPTEGLRGVFERLKTWLQSIYKSADDLNVDLTPEVREVFDRMLGADFVKTESAEQSVSAEDKAADYEAVANTEPESTLLSDTADGFRDVSNLASNAFVPVSTRLGNIDQALKHAVRKFLFGTGLHSHEDRTKLKPFIEGVSNKMTPEDYRVLDLAFKNRDTEKVDFLIEKYGLQKEYAAVREVLDGLYTAAKDVGIEVGYVDDYFPRKVKRGMVGEYMAAMRKQKQWSDIKIAMRQADPEGLFDEEEQAEFVNSYLRGYAQSTLKMSKSGHTKGRTVSYIKPEFNKYYEDSLDTLMKYVTGVRHGIEARKMFGKSEKETDENIGAYVLDLVNDGIIQPEQEDELRQILKAVVEPTGTYGAVSWAKNASYIYLMGNPLSAITQIQDLAFSLTANGYFRTGVSLAKALTGNTVARKEDIGIENILQEFEDVTRASEAVRKTFRLVGLEWMDNVGKHTFIDAAYGRLQAANKKGGKKWDDFLDTVFGDEADQVKADLASGEMSENVKYLLFSELSDYQPISLAEMPLYYLKSGNGRIFYMLKSYTIKQIDTYRREIFAKLASGDVATTAEGVKSLVSLSVALMLLGMGSDALKNLILGREIDIDNLILDNALKLFGFTKYQIYKSREEGIMQTFWKTLFIPPIGAPIDDLNKDIKNIAMGKKDKKTGKTTKKPLKDAEVLQRVPFVGKLYYWWYGGGKAKLDKGKKKVSPL